LKRPAILRGGAHNENGAQIYYQAPYKPAQLYVPVPAHYKARSSDCAILLLFLGL